MYVLRRDVAQVHLIDACAVVHVKCHTGRCHDVVYGEIWIVGQFGRVMRRSCELPVRCVEAAHAVSCFDFLYDFEKPCSSRYTIRLDGWRGGKADCLFRTALIRHHQIGGQRIKPTFHALHRCVE